MRRRIRERYTATMDPRILAKLDEIRGRISRSTIIEEAVKIELLRRLIVQSDYEQYTQTDKSQETQTPA